MHTNVKLYCTTCVQWSGKKNSKINTFCYQMNNLNKNCWIFIPFGNTFFVHHFPWSRCWQIGKWRHRRRRIFIVLWQTTFYPFFLYTPPLFSFYYWWWRLDQKILFHFLQWRSNLKLFYITYFCHCWQKYIFINNVWILITPMFKARVSKCEYEFQRVMLWL